MRKCIFPLETVRSRQRRTGTSRPRVSDDRRAPSRIQGSARFPPGGRLGHAVLKFLLVAGVGIAAAGEQGERVVRVDPDLVVQFPSHGEARRAQPGPGPKGEQKGHDPSSWFGGFGSVGKTGRGRWCSTKEIEPEVRTS